MLTFPSAHDILLAHSLTSCKYMNTKMLYLFQALGQKRRLRPGIAETLQRNNLRFFEATLTALALWFYARSPNA